MKPDHVKCENCIFWENHGKSEYGLCHRYPPTPVTTPQRLIEGIAAIYSAVARVSLDDNSEIEQFVEPGYIMEYSDTATSEGKSWCGEFKAEWPA